MLTCTGSSWGEYLCQRSSSKITASPNVSSCILCNPNSDTCLDIFNPNVNHDDVALRRLSTEISSRSRVITNPPTADPLSFILIFTYFRVPLSIMELAVCRQRSLDHLSATPLKTMHLRVRGKIWRNSLRYTIHIDLFALVITPLPHRL